MIASIIKYMTILLSLSGFHGDAYGMACGYTPDLYKHINESLKSMEVDSIGYSIYFYPDVCGSDINVMFKKDDIAFYVTTYSDSILAKELFFPEERVVRQIMDGLSNFYVLKRENMFSFMEKAKARQTDDAGCQYLWLYKDGQKELHTYSLGDYWTTKRQHVGDSVVIYSDEYKKFIQLMFYLSSRYHGGDYWLRYKDFLYRMKRESHPENFTEYGFPDPLTIFNTPTYEQF